MASPSKTIVNMKVPADMVAELQRHMQQLQMAAEGPPSIPEAMEEDEEEEEEEYKQVEVSRIKSHRIVNGKFEFEIVWKGYRGSDWVKDEHCNCERTISAYLRERGIRTAYLFCRVSTKDQARGNCVSLEAQEVELRAAATELRFARIKVYQISASAYRNIPSALKYIGECCTDTSAILVWRADRLSRNIVKYLAWMEDLHNRGVTLYSHQEKITYAGHKLTFLQAVLDAQKSSHNLGERVKLALRRKRARGDEKIGGLPYGKRYRRILRADGRTKRMVVEDHPEEKAIINHVRRARESYSAIATRLNRAGIKKKGRKWSAGMVKRMKGE